MLKLSGIFKDGMVLQRDCPLKVWGRSDPFAKVTLKFCGKETQADSDSGGKWLASLLPCGPGGPFEMEIEACGEWITLKDILVGDVWLLTGQSNMQVPLSFARKDWETVKDNFSAIRQFTVPMNMNFREPEEEFAPWNTIMPPLSEPPEGAPKPPPDGQWFRADPEGMPFFSAAGYFFACKIHEKYAVPIGLIQTAIGGTRVEAWMSREALGDYPLELDEADFWADDEKVRKSGEDDAAWLVAWNKALDASDPGLREGWQAENWDDSSWDGMSLCDDWDLHPEFPSPGSVWFRKVVEVPPELAAKSCRLQLGMLVDGDRTYINGILVGSGDTRWFNRDYPAVSLKPGKNIIVIRILSQFGLGRAVPGEYPETRQRLFWPDTGDEILLDRGDWKCHGGSASRPLKPGTVIFYKPTGLYHGMIAPLHNYAIRGGLWYQGESNAEAPNGYADHFQKMVTDWREKWGLGNFPFLWVQLPNFQPLEKEAVNWAYMREEQRRCRSLPQSGMVVAIDAGDTWDIHPQAKRVIGERLAMTAFHYAYGEDLVYSGPEFRDISVSGNRAKLGFTSIGGGLASADGGPLRGFTVFDGRKYHSADAAIENDTVVVSCPGAAAIKAVRYAWESDPTGVNLINREGFPAGPFDTRFSSLRP
jgi:sialate O-acetylesterase